MSAEDELRRLRTQAHWRVRLERTQQELDEAKQLSERLSTPAKKDFDRYLALLKDELAWLNKMIV